MELRKVDTLEEAMEKLLRYAAGCSGLPMETERVPLTELPGRILAEDVFCQDPVPGFHRSTVDGYAVRSSDTGGASESLPVFLKVIGEVEMGKAAEVTVGPGGGRCRGDGGRRRGMGGPASWKRAEWKRTGQRAGGCRRGVRGCGSRGGAGLPADGGQLQCFRRCEHGDGRR